MSEQIACLCGCQRIAQQRGLAIRCLRRLQRFIARGETTEAKEIAAGKLLPKSDKKVRPAWWRHGR